MRIEDFDYPLPKEQIAQYPQRERDESRLLVYRRDDRGLEHTVFKEITRYLLAGDVLVLNNTKVIPARLKATDERGRPVDMLLLERACEHEWFCLVKGVKGRERERVIRIGELEGTVRKDGTFWILRLPYDVEQLLPSLGTMPLPPYIKRDVLPLDFERYQTVYAEEPGSIAAPTAGFHFTEALLQRLMEQGVHVVKVTLHIGIGTFSIPKKERVEDHRMEREFYSADGAVWQEILCAKREGRRVIACGTSVVRTIETIFSKPSASLRGFTDLFIYPGYTFAVVDGLITNFHLPRSTPLLLVAAFMGKEELFRCYEEAIREGYRFLSYGDAMLIL